MPLEMRKDTVSGEKDRVPLMNPKILGDMDARVHIFGTRKRMVPNIILRLILLQDSPGTHCKRD